MTGLQEYLGRAIKEQWAVGHFNCSEFDQMRAITEACKEVGAPAMIGTSEGERKHIDLDLAIGMRDALKKEYGIPIFLNADHTYSVDAAKSAVDAGYDSIHIDLSKLSFDENLAGVKEVVEYARAKDANISIEGEVGYIVTDSSKVYKEAVVIPPESLTKPEEAEQFTKETGIDRLAPAVGSIHGIAANEPHLDIERISMIRERIPSSVAMVLHGGSGVTDDDLKRAIAAGMSNVHVSTELRVAYTNALREEMSEHSSEIAMYKLDTKAYDAMKAVVKEKLELFGSINKI